MVTVPPAPALAVKLKSALVAPISLLIPIVPRVDCNPKDRMLLPSTLLMVPVTVIPPPTFIWVFCATTRLPAKTAPDDAEVVIVIAEVVPKVTSTKPF